MPTLLEEKQQANALQSFNLAVIENMPESAIKICTTNDKCEKVTLRLSREESRVLIGMISKVCNTGGGSVSHIKQPAVVSHEVRPGIRFWQHEN